jgi:uncharacterized surface protein with fasciclin (FAS1) repeats
MKKFFVLAVAALFSLALVQADEKKAAGNLAEVVTGSKDHSTLLTAVKAAGLVDALTGKDELTVLGPTNAAFEKIDKDTLAAVLKDKEKLTAILTAHVFKGKLMAADVVKLDGKKIKSLQGTEFEVKVDGKKVTIGGATVTTADVAASNGVIHVIDTVLMPAAK